MKKLLIIAITILMFFFKSQSIASYEKVFFCLMLLNISHKSHPSISGILISKKIRSGFWRATSPMASSPDEIATTSWSPLSSSSPCSIAALVSVSSMMRTRDAVRECVVVFAVINGRPDKRSLTMLSWALAYYDSDLVGGRLAWRLVGA